MSFRAYLDDIETKTGKTADAFLALATEQGFVADGALRPGVKAGQIIDWLKADFDLGHGHAMSLVAYFKGRRS